MRETFKKNVSNSKRGINEVIKGEKKTFLFRGLKMLWVRYKNGNILTKLMYVRYKNFLGAIFKKKTNRNKSR
ncbi:hypothetical protein B7687_08145 [Campylobacter coli]|nr:hypothetical protein [Campylobacter coli]EAK3663566.1 hypothetical protein [Campylobacter coli]EAL0485987.1 hypothetical protein [Campylobacter coli]EDO7977986.1 hypothetical protein [Campylobacter coli]